MRGKPVHQILGQLNGSPKQGVAVAPAAATAVLPEELYVFQPTADGTYVSAPTAVDPGGVKYAVKTGVDFYFSPGEGDFFAFFSAAGNLFRMK